MTTARTLIEDALGEIGVKDEGQSLPNEQASHGLRVLNRMLGRWSQRRLLLPVITEVTVALTGAQTYTIGPSGAVSSLRPIKVENARHRISGVDYPVRVLSQQEWIERSYKGMPGDVVGAVWYEATNTNGTLRVDLASAVGALKLNVRALVASFASLDAVLQLPDGYEDAIVPSLADALAATYGKATPPDVLRRATSAVRAIKNANAEPIYLRTDLSEYVDTLPVYIDSNVVAPSSTYMDEDYVAIDYVA